MTTPSTRIIMPQHRRALTLIELLVVMAIIAVLMSILVPALSSTRETARSLVCASDMKSIAVEFSLFAAADPMINRGDSARLGRQFWINDFQESLYRLSEFWDLGDSPRGPVEGPAELMLCPDGPGPLTKRQDLPCSSAAFDPVVNVSLAMNRRLYQAEVEFAGQVVLASTTSTRVGPAALEHPYAPLVLDVDAEEALRKDKEPVYTAPPGSRVEGPYADGDYWMPAARHAGKTNVAFIGGHVQSSSDPAAQNWDWDYQADTE